MSSGFCKDLMPSRLYSWLAFTICLQKVVFDTLPIYNYVEEKNIYIRVGKHIAQTSQIEHGWFGLYYAYM